MVLASDLGCLAASVIVLPLIALTGRAAPEDIERGRGAGFTDYVAKFDRSALLESLRQCLAPPVAG